MKLNPSLIFTLALSSVLPTHAAALPPTPPGPQVAQGSNTQSINRGALPTGSTHRENDDLVCNLLEGDQENPENDQKVLNYCFQSNHCSATGVFVIDVRNRNLNTVVVLESIYPALFQMNPGKRRGRELGKEICTGTGPKPAPRIKCICKVTAVNRRKEGGYPPECSILGKVDNQHPVSELCRKASQCVKVNPTTKNKGSLSVTKYKLFVNHQVYGSMFSDIRARSDLTTNQRTKEMRDLVMDICKGRKPNFPVKISCECVRPAGPNTAAGNPAAPQPPAGSDDAGVGEESQPGASSNPSDTGHASDGPPVAHAPTRPQAQGQSSSAQDASDGPPPVAYTPTRPQAQSQSSTQDFGQASRGTIRPHESDPDSDSDASTGQAPPPAKVPRLGSEEAADTEAANVLININRDSW